MWVVSITGKVLTEELTGSLIQCGLVPVAEQLSLLVGQILSPGADLVSQLTSMGGALASQIEQKGEGAEEDAPGAAPEASAEAAPAAE